MEKKRFKTECTVNNEIITDKLLFDNIIQETKLKCISEALKEYSNFKMETTIINTTKEIPDYYYFEYNNLLDLYFYNLTYKTSLIQVVVTAWN